MAGNKRQQIGKMKVNIYIYNVYEMTNELGLFQEKSIEAETWNGVACRFQTFRGE